MTKARIVVIIVEEIYMVKKWQVPSKAAEFIKKDQIWGVSQNIVKKFRKNSLQKFDIIDHMQ